MLKFFLGLGIGFLLGFFGVITLLFLYVKKQERKKYLGSKEAKFIPNKKSK